MSLPTKDELLAEALRTIESTGCKLGQTSMEMPDNLSREAWVKVGQALELIRCITHQEEPNTRRTKPRTKSVNPNRDSPNKPATEAEQLDLFGVGN